jgi:bifunctional DNA-binding transcriptional regulator/antitoxin component of YhaV-PrlF toxin-antitoxin module
LLYLLIVAKVTSKLQLTLPKVIADQYKIRPGDDLDWLPAGEAIRVVKRDADQAARPDTIKQRLQLFDQATDRQRKRQTKSGMGRPAVGARSSRAQSDRGWTREEIYQRGLSR